MNKYNIRAIRNDLDSCIRYKSWKKFKSVFQSLDLNLQQAVVKQSTRKNGSKEISSPSLLIALFRCIKPSYQPPLDVFESVLQACPYIFLNNKNNSASPLSIAIERHATAALIEVILRYDETKQSLYMKGRSGDTPILAVIRQRRQIQGHYQTSSEDFFKLLLKYDKTKQSLLIRSKAKLRVPLYYVASQELSFLSHDEKDDDGDMEDASHTVDLDEGLEFLLLQTFKAILIQRGKMLNTTLENDKVDEDEDENGFFRDASSTALGISNEFETRKRILLLLHASIACAHLLGSKNNLRLLLYLITILKRGNVKYSQLLDDNGDSLTHHVCRAQESAVFLEQSLVDNAKGAKVNLLQYLIKASPHVLSLSNKDGEIPLHLAIQTRKSWDFLQHLCDEEEISIFRAKTNHDQNALHLMIGRYPSNSKEIINLWSLYPEAATEMDGKLRLFAFQLLAVTNAKDCKIEDQGVGNPKTNRSKDEHDRSSKNRGDEPHYKDVELIYLVLRSSPQVLQQTEYHRDVQS
jgi:hypothetical protein